MNLLRIALLALLLLAMPLTIVLAQSGGDYDLSWNTLDNGAGLSTGGNYSLVDSIAQPDASNPLSGGSFALRGGFLLCAVRSAVADVAIGDAGSGDARLNWSGPGTYDVWKSSAPYFQVGDPGATLDGDEVTSPYTASGVIGDAATNYFFLVIAQNDCGISSPSNRTGEFDFALIPGSP